MWLTGFFWACTSEDRMVWEVIDCFSVLYQMNKVFLYFSVGEGNGNPLQYSCLENPMDGGAW